KLAYTLHGRTPTPTSLLPFYHTERSANAQELIDFDRTFSSMFSGKRGQKTGLSHEQFLAVFNKGNGFTYPAKPLVDKRDVIGVLSEEKRYLSGVLRPRRGLLNVCVYLYA
ncbi:hypothetical protein BBP40_008518, partial [Aspergillus hancockii]